MATFGQLPQNYHPEPAACGLFLGAAFPGKPRRPEWERGGPALRGRAPLGAARRGRDRGPGEGGAVEALAILPALLFVVGLHLVQLAALGFEPAAVSRVNLPGHAVGATVATIGKRSSVGGLVKPASKPEPGPRQFPTRAVEALAILPARPFVVGLYPVQLAAVGFEVRVKMERLSPADPAGAALRGRAPLGATRRARDRAGGRQLGEPPRARGRRDRGHHRQGHGVRCGRLGGASQPASRSPARRWFPTRAVDALPILPAPTFAVGLQLVQLAAVGFEVRAKVERLRPCRPAGAALRDRAPPGAARRARVRAGGRQSGEPPRARGRPDRGHHRQRVRGQAWAAWWSQPASRSPTRRQFPTRAVEALPILPTLLFVVGLHLVQLAAVGFEARVKVERLRPCGSCRRCTSWSGATWCSSPRSG